MVDRGVDPERRLADREQRGLRRTLDPAESVRSRTRFAPDPGSGSADFDDAKYVFASNDYLGLAGDDRLAAAAELGARTVGSGAGASRLVTGDTRMHRALERDLADWKATERALVFSSGYAANVGTIQAIDPDVVFSDGANHASIVDGCRLAASETVVYDHCDPADLRERMAARAAGPGTTDAHDTDPAAQTWLVVTDTVFSMDGDVAPLDAICDVAEEFGATVMVDEAHATGVVGPEGAGVVAERGLGDRVDVQLGTLSKAIGAQGGFVAGDAALVEYLANVARSFVYSTGLAPPVAAAARRGCQIARESDRRERLRANAARLREGLVDAGYEVAGDSHLLPVRVGDRDDAVALADHLDEQGIRAPAIRPPTVPEGESLVRVSPMATHDDAAIETCLEAFRSGRRVVDQA